jgi:hypothetical protein
MFKAVYNACYGGFGMSEKGLKLYNNITSQDIKYADIICRYDPVLVELVETMGREVNDNYSKLKIKEFPIKFKSFLQWSEYDGYESVSIDYNKYLIYHIRQINCDKSLSSDMKVLQIQNLYDEYDMRPNSDYE